VADNRVTDKRGASGASPVVLGGLDGLTTGSVLPGAIISKLTTSQVSYSGPIPPPHFMREFNEIIPNGADRILAMAEKQLDHRILLESRALKSGILRSWGGLVAGFVIGMTAICFGGTALLQGQALGGYALCLTGIASLVGVFVLGKYFTSKERIDKDRNMKRK
jgi:uncharacterized membrane protein